MTTPALLRLREALPGVQIHLLSPQKLSALWVAHPAVDRVVAFGPGEGVWQVSRRIRREGADVSLILPNSLRSALEPWLGRVPRRIGISTRGRRWWLTEAIEPDPKAVKMRKRSPEEIRAGLQEARSIQPVPSAESHHTRHYLRLVEALGADPTAVAPFLRVTDDERMAMRKPAGLGSIPERNMVRPSAGRPRTLGGCCRTCGHGDAACRWSFLAAEQMWKPRGWWPPMGPAMSSTWPVGLVCAN